eukprot:TRINITY_DN10203_c1_g5_i1.p1 TRINITY_DN10203_c1_g5~~TRINITY_DN10203_c1_g5_i1.p1  ORF type:complete len:1678 (+),score=313.33 TRINITY_DN10203_c1_g5_i1:53-5086(+)
MAMRALVALHSIWIAGLVGSGAAVASASGTDKRTPFKVQAQVLSGWPGTPSVAQSLEWLRDVDSLDARAYLWELVQAASASDHANITALADVHIRSGSARTFHELLVRNAYYSPRIEALRTLERQDRKMYGASCPSSTTAWALLWRGAEPVAACNAKTLHAELQKAPLQMESGFKASHLDLSLHSVPQAGSVVVVYGALSGDGLQELAALLKDVNPNTKEFAWSIVFRHADGPGITGPELLTGYGYELAIKSSEYKTHADDQKEDAAKQQDAPAADDTERSIKVSEETMELDGPLEIDGIHFDVLLKRNAALRNRIWAFKEQLESEQDTDKAFKAWEIKDIGLQAVAKIMASKRPLMSLMQVAQNFPAQVASLVRQSVPSGLRDEVEMLRGMLQPGAEIFSVNNRMVHADHGALSLFPIMKTLLPFFVGVEQFVRTGVPEKVACEILKEAASPQALSEKLDWRSKLLPKEIYHVATDRNTRDWQTSLMAMMYGGGLQGMRIALFTLVAVFDPADVVTLRVVRDIIDMLPLAMVVHLALVPGHSTVAAPSWDEEMLGRPPSWVAGTDKTGGGTTTAEARVSHIIAAAFGHLLKEKTAKKARKFIKLIGDMADTLSSEELRIPDTPDMVKKIEEAFKDTLSKPDEADSRWKGILNGTADGSNHGKEARAYAEHLGVPLPAMLVNGNLLVGSALESKKSVFQFFGGEMQTIQQGMMRHGMAAMYGDGQKIVESIVLSGNFQEAYHPDITPELAQRGGEEGAKAQMEATTNLIYVQFPRDSFLELPFFRSTTQIQQRPVIFFHVLRLKSLDQTYLLRTFATHMLLASDVSESRLAVLFEPSDGSRDALHELRSCLSGLLALAVASSNDAGAEEAEEAIEALTRSKLQVLKFLGSAVPAAAGSLAPGRVSELCELAISKKLDPAFHAKARAQIAAPISDSVLARESSLLQAARAAVSSVDVNGSAMWICNGRAIVLNSPAFPRHVAALEAVEGQYDRVDAKTEEQEEEEDPDSKQTKSPKVKALHEWLAEAVDEEGRPMTLSPNMLGLAAAIRATTLIHGKFQRFVPPKQLTELGLKYLRLDFAPPRPEAASPIKVFGLLDPLSTTAQFSSTVLALFGMVFNAEVTLILNPTVGYTEYPLKRYYREVVRWPERLADGSASSELEGGQIGGGSAVFQLATQHTLTAAIHTLPTWLVTAQEAYHDMDNLRAVDVLDDSAGKERGLCNVSYVLRQLYVEGQAFILGPSGWPQGPAQGLQLEVKAVGARDISSDTSVMANLGYFQIFGNPGFHAVQLKSGLSNDTFTIAGSSEVEVSSYITPPYQLRVDVRPGRNAKDLFEKDGDRKQKPSSMASLFGGLTDMLQGVMDKSKKKDDKAVKATDPAPVAKSDDALPTVHIFSVASGHLYEKLLGIMILSVRNQTKCPLHFWFIDQFMSPKFKLLIPEMAKRYDFDFSFVTYKWPSWLNAQTEKQRLIWAYKVLFLDVLFPLDVPKIIYIDADQVVRADVKELWDMDLDGKVYGFTPMCGSNPDVEGFRFWNQGYWKNHLNGLPYHISALFVVDLDEFRRTSTGDALRRVYNSLSQDPNSLANLDQDLPNFAQHQIPIFSLPQEWLWCETWCSLETKPKAKTIDLCQNPLTKEPKIVMAKRIIAEWQDYHDEVARFQGELVASSGSGGAIDSTEKNEL